MFFIQTYGPKKGNFMAVIIPVSYFLINDVLVYAPYGNYEINFSFQESVFIKEWKIKIFIYLEG